ncbi:MAG: hypothetical protein GXY67_08395 [Clostridiales bacterium]|nr:hypothetical protein [Clostridiales bacterium]
MSPSSPMPKASALSAGLCNASLLLYILWLLLPAVQTIGGALAGGATVAVFGVGLLLDFPYLKSRWPRVLLRLLLMAALPLVLRFFLRRGTDHFLGYYAQQVMFWFPLLFCGYARDREDPRLWRWVKETLLCAFALTTLTTLGWLIQGMLRGGRIYAYARSLGSGEPGREAYLTELMLRNIGGYDFIYASVLSLPLTCFAMQQYRGWKRLGFSVFCILQYGMIALSQYTYALIFATALLVMEGLAALLRRLSLRLFKRPMSVLASLLWTLPLFLAVFLARVPLVSWAASLCRHLGMENFSISLHQLLDAMSGTITDSATRLDYYRLPLQGIAASPLLGALPGTGALLSQHSDLLDLLSALGILGGLAFIALVWLLGQGSLRGAFHSEARPHLLLQWAVLLALTVVSTVVYSREIPLLLCLGATLSMMAAAPQTGASSKAK